MDKACLQEESEVVFAEEFDNFHTNIEEPAVVLDIFLFILRLILGSAQDKGRVFKFWRLLAVSSLCLAVK